MSIFRLITGVALSLALVQSAVAVPSQTTPEVAARAGLSVNPVGIALTPLTTVAPAKRMTNAQRMARGLAPNPPVRRAAGHLKARQSATPTSSASDTPTPTPTPTPTCTTTTGFLKARYGSDAGGYTDGYVSSSMNDFGEYGFTSSPTSAMAISFEQCTDNTNPISVLVTNGQTAYPVIAAVTGFANSGDQDHLGPGSINYAYLAGTGSEVPYGTTPQPQANSFSTATGIQNDVETALFTIDTSSGAVTTAWYNVDGSAPASTVAYYPSDDVFIIVGDYDEFQSNFGDVYETEFTFVTTLPPVE